MYCQKCGSIILADAKFCPKCGTNLCGFSAEPILQTPTSVHQTPVNPRNSTLRKPVILLLAFSALMALAVFLWFTSREDQVDYTGFRGLSWDSAPTKDMSYKETSNGLETYVKDHEDLTYLGERLFEITYYYENRKLTMVIAILHWDADWNRIRKALQKQLGPPSNSISEMPAFTWNNGPGLVLLNDTPTGMRWLSFAKKDK
jgi:hypothetical protein